MALLGELAMVLSFQNCFIKDESFLSLEHSRHVNINLSSGKSKNVVFQTTWDTLRSLMGDRSATSSCYWVARFHLLPAGFRVFGSWEKLLKCTEQELFAQKFCFKGPLRHREVLTRILMALSLSCISLSFSRSSSCSFWLLTSRSLSSSSVTYSPNACKFTRITQFTTSLVLPPKPANIFSR